MRTSKFWYEQEERYKHKSMNYKGSNFGEHGKYIDKDDFQVVESQG